MVIWTMKLKEIEDFTSLYDSSFTETSNSETNSNQDISDAEWLGPLDCAPLLDYKGVVRKLSA